MQKICFVCLASYFAPNIGGFDPESIHRQESYAVALSQLLDIAPAGVELLIVDNTVGSSEELSDSLRAQFSAEMIKDVMFINNNKLGSKNKGAGEYVMCREIIKKHEAYLRDFDWVVYYTSRHIVAFPVIFEHLKRYSDKQAIVSSAEYIFANGSRSVPDEKGYDDVIFAMKPALFMDYATSLEPEKLVTLHMSSESNLYNFVHDNKLDFQKVHRWGLVRYDYGYGKTEII